MCNLLLARLARQTRQARLARLARLPGSARPTDPARPAPLARQPANTRKWTIKKKMILRTSCSMAILHIRSFSFEPFIFRRGRSHLNHSFSGAGGAVFIWTIYFSGGTISFANIATLQYIFFISYLFTDTFTQTFFSDNMFTTPGFVFIFVLAALIKDAGNKTVCFRFPNRSSVNSMLNNGSELLFTDTINSQQSCNY